MEFKGTKGKWIIDENGDVITDLKYYTGDIVCLKPEELEESLVNWEANALLISKAPEMLEMLNRFLEITNSFVHPGVDHLRGSARQLIKEATQI